ncbi:MAG TPA: hypothetical protein VIZ28_08140 [Chitinophagaceae bacterium]
MKTHLYKICSIGFIVIAFSSCKRQVDAPAIQKGSLDASKYVSVGSSISAGYTDNALYYNGQVVSYPNLLAQQFKLIGGGNFKQPLVPVASVGIGASLNARYVLAPFTDCAGITSLAPVYAQASGDLGIFTTSVAADGPFNNISVPGLKATTAVYPGYGDYTQGAGNFNPFFTRMTANPQSASVLSDAASQGPTFFSLFIGSDDVMGYALAGAAADAITPSAGPAGYGFDESIDAIVNTLTAFGAKGVIANIPGIHTLPYFTTIPPNGLMLDAANAAALTAAYAALDIPFHAGSNGFMIQDATAPAGIRQIKATEMVLLTVPQDSLKCAGWGSMKPIPHQYVLTETELTEINNAISAYNTKLKSVADAKGLAFVDVNAFMSRAQAGIMYNGIGMNAQFVSGGIFSLDGVDLTPIGNAFLANEFIKAINAKYVSTIPQIDATSYKGVSFP